MNIFIKGLLIIVLICFITSCLLKIDSTYYYIYGDSYNRDRVNELADLFFAASIIIGAVGMSLLLINSIILP